MYLNPTSGNIGLSRQGSLKLTVVSTGVAITGNLAVSGNITYSGTITDTSSRRFKENIVSATISKEDLLALDLVRYNLKAYPQNRPSVGFIAEELHKLESCKQFVTYDENDEPAGIVYDKLAISYIELLKDHETRIQALENGAN
jgi:hypothetical protein